MKAKLFFIILCLNSLICVSQVIYSDEFNEGINNFTSSTSLSTSINGQNLQIIGNGTAGAWENLVYSFHSSATGINVDASSNPKLYIKIKAENTPEIRIDFIDANGYVTNLNPSSITPNANYQIFEIDYNGKFTDAGSVGTCTSGPCNVDDTQLTGLMFFFNPSVGGYNGTVEIESISIGDSIGSKVDYEIRYNQVGYFVNRDKLISITSNNSFSPKNFTILDANNNIVLSGTSESINYWADSDEYVSKVDISSLNTPGTYKFKTNQSEVLFHIGSDVYQSISEASLKYYYYNRASTSISSTYGGVFARNFGHPDTQVYVHSSAASSSRPTGTIISSSKGWYDAGDYNKYIVNSGISTYTLLAAYEHFENYYKSKIIDIPEKGGGIPDILDEVKWNLDWMLTMQEPADGGVYHKLTGLNFSGIVMPENYNLDRYVIQKSTAATLNFAAVMAIASRIFSNYNAELPGYGATLLNAAQSAYTWAKSNPTIYFTNPGGVSTGEYGDTDVTDEFQWAAAELFITTGDANYNNDLNLSIIGNGTPTWQYTDPLALISIIHHSSSFSLGTVNVAKSLLLSTADVLKNQVENSVMNIAMGVSNWDYVWGSNGVAANQIVILIRAYEATSDVSYLDAAYTAMDYLLGRNGTGYCYVTGFGDYSTVNPHHRISEADQIVKPVPGMLAGGPNPGQQDGCSGYLNNANAGSYVDDWCSYASNEVTINWNAPLAYSLNALHFYQNEDIITANDYYDIQENIVVYPNPTEGVFNINSSYNIESVIIYNAIGKIIYTGKSKNLNLSNFPDGLYFLKLNSHNKTITRRIVKK